MSSSHKSPLESKKFILTIFSMLILAGIVVFISFTQTINWAIASFLALIAIGLIVIPVGTILGMSAIDKVATMIEDVTDMFGGKDDDSSSEG